ncbi:MAG TPA: FkbM family methyltransferase [Rhizomicrobium sp.]|nr:FkbM family methyltransferase [Rhizomicrobium sp.]
MTGTRANPLIMAGVNIYRSLPVSPAQRRKLKAFVFRFFPRKKTLFQHRWRGLNLNLDPDQSIDMRLYYTGDYEPNTLGAIEKLIRKGSVVIDIGANIGVVSLWMAKCAGPDGLVIAVEPSAWAVSRLRANAALNQDLKIEVVRAAAADEEGERQMNVLNGYRIDDIDSNTFEMVPFKKIDSIVRERVLDRVDMIKIDTDGYETVVLSGAKETIARFHPTIIFELGRDHLKEAGSSAEELIDWLRGFGYVFKDENLDPVDPLQVAAKLPVEYSVNIVAIRP